MKNNTAVEFAYLLLAKGVHFDEIERFVDAEKLVDPRGETIPAPPDTERTVSTVPSPSGSVESGVVRDTTIWAPAIGIAS